jgi:hypothetical protein
MEYNTLAVCLIKFSKLSFQIYTFSFVMLWAMTPGDYQSFRVTCCINLWEHLLMMREAECLSDFNLLPYYTAS